MDELNEGKIHESIQLTHIEQIQEIVVNTAKKYKDVENIKGMINASHKAFYEIDLGSGYAGICVLLAQMDRLYPEERWDMIAHEYMREIQIGLQKKGLKSLGLWPGLSGILIATNFLSKDGSRYTTFFKRLTDLFAQNFQPLLYQANKNLSKGAFIREFDLIEGFAGIGRMLLYFSKEDAWMRQALNEVLCYFVEFCKEKKINGEWLPGWYTPTEAQLSIEIRKKFVKGSFNFGLSHGLPGPLMLLTLAWEKGFRVPGQKEAIYKMIDWLLKYKKKDDYGIYWPLQLGYTEFKHFNPNSPTYHKEAWCYGSPGISRVLWVAGKIFNEILWKQTAIDALRATSERPKNKWNIYSPTFCHGLSGLLYLTHLMYIDTGETFLKKLRDTLLNQLLEYSNKKAPLLFDDLQETDDGLIRMANPGLLNGVAGVLLVLSSLLQDTKLPWDIVFLLN
jgi:lantibiotic biosynthesis protein